MRWHLDFLIFYSLPLPSTIVKIGDDDNEEFFVVLVAFCLSVLLNMYGLYKNRKAARNAAAVEFQLNRQNGEFDVASQYTGYASNQSARVTVDENSQHDGNLLVAIKNKFTN